MRDNGFVYQINYPPTIPKVKGFLLNNEKDDSLFVRGNTKVPVVILFGWAYSRNKHLEKYSAIYEDRGYITVRCTADLRVLTTRLFKAPGVARRFLDLLHEKSLDEHPIICHVFSNGGTYLYQNVSLEMRKRKKSLQIKGVIFDSGLCRRRFYPLFCAGRTIIGGPAIYNVPMSLFICSILFVYWMLLPFILALITFNKPQAVDIVLDEEPYNWPQLLIYSKNDEFNSWEDVEEFARRREEKGVKVTKLCFENSPHVQHLITHRETYINTIEKFLQACLS